jgi:pimeloyl-ACP methyl ester carboxylesterase
VEHGQPANSGIEDADRPCVHPAIVSPGYAVQPMRGVLALISAIAAIGGSGSSRAASPIELTLAMDDGAQIACAFNTSPGPAPAIMLFHGLGGKHQDLAPVADAFRGAGYATLACDARGHGTSGGLADIDGPRTIADIREEFAWLAGRPGVEGNHVGAWGISLGGGAVWRSLVGGIPFAAVETVETWTDLFQALAPQHLAKSGAVYGFLNSLPASRTDPSVLAIKSDALSSSNLARVKTNFADPRSSRSALGSITTPALVFQGRRDFAFGLEQGIELYQGLAGPKRLYIGDFGHQPSTFPGPDIAPMTAEAIDWFDHYLRGRANGIETRKPVELAPDPFREAQNVSYPGLPPTRTASFGGCGRKTIDGSGKVVRTIGRAHAKLETFGSATVRVKLKTGRGWTHVIAVLTARTPNGSTILVSDGGVPTNAGRRTATIRLLSDATLIPRGSRLALTLAGSSTAQSAGNLLYLGTVPASAKITIGCASVGIPVLRGPISG